MNNAPAAVTPSPNLPAKWLVMRLGHMGDVVLTTGVLLYLGERFGWKFHVLTKPAWAGVFDHHPYVEKVIPFTPEISLKALAREYAGWGLLDYNANLRSRALGLMWKGVVARYPKQGLTRRLYLLTRSRAQSVKLLAANVPQRYTLAVLPKAPRPQELLPKIFLSPEETARGIELARAAAGQEGNAGKPIVALHPFASYPEKTWPPEYWRTLADTLDAAGIPWVALGKGKPVFADNPRDLTDKTTLRETCAILAAAACLVSGDSGPMHLAAGAGTPVIGLFGPTTREWGFFPAGPKDVILESNQPCRPCSLHGKRPCGRKHVCLRDISPGRVMESIQGIVYMRDQRA